MSRKAKDIFGAVLQWVLKEWVKALLGAVAVIVLGCLGLVYHTYLKNWLVAQHSLGFYGWAWILIPLFITVLSILIFWLLTKQKILYKDEEDIRNMLEQWFRKFSTNYRGRPKPNLTINFALCDKINHLNKGSSEKYLEPIANALGYRTIRKAKTIRLEYKYTTQAKRSGFLDDLY